MQTGRSVQFQNIESVINAYELRAVPAFSIYQGKQLLIKYEGSDILEGSELLAQFLPMLLNSAAIYTLCVYEEFSGKINDKSPYHGSYNFKFVENTAGYNASNNVLQSLQSQLAAMDEKLTRIETEKELSVNDDSTINSMDRIGNILSHPLIEKLIPVVMGFLQPSEETKKLPAVMAGIETASKGISKELNEAIINMLSATAESEQALIKLGAVAKKDPGKFKKLLGYMTFI
jgi:hypothetical protein